MSVKPKGAPEPKGCPFFGVILRPVQTEGLPPYNEDEEAEGNIGRIIPAEILIPYPTFGRECGLIADMRILCWMTETERRPPEWRDCPRNPMWLAERMMRQPEPGQLDEETAERFLAHLKDLTEQRIKVKDTE